MKPVFIALCAVTLLAGWMFPQEQRSLRPCKPPLPEPRSSSLAAASRLDIPECCWINPWWCR